MEVDDAGFVLFPRGKNSKSFEALRYPGIVLGVKHFKIPMALEMIPKSFLESLTPKLTKRRYKVAGTCLTVRIDYLKLLL